MALDYGEIEAQQEACSNILTSLCAQGFDENCVSTYCKGSVLGPCAPACCAQADPASCLASDGSGGSGQDPNQQGCSTVVNFISICESYTPGFSTLPATDQVSCLCYSSTDFRPDLWDNAAASCYSYLYSENAATAASWSNVDVGFCTRYGSVAAAATTILGAAATTTLGAAATTTPASLPSTSAVYTVATQTAAATSVTASSAAALTCAHFVPSPGFSRTALLLLAAVMFLTAQLL